MSDPAAIYAELFPEKTMSKRERKKQRARARERARQAKRNAARQAAAAENATDAAPKKVRMIPALDVIARIRWDAALSDDAWILGYEDRFTGIQEVTLQQWDEGLDHGLGSIPSHRIRYFSRNGTIVWDRRTRKALAPFDAPAPAAAAPLAA